MIPKSDGSQRAPAILVLEDKIVQRAVASLLEAIYEPQFYGLSHGFRRGHSAHEALSRLRDQCLKRGDQLDDSCRHCQIFGSIPILHFGY